MKKQSVIKKLHKPVHPILGKIVLGACIIVIVCAIVIMFEQQPVSPTSTRQSTPPTPTSILAQSPPSVTPILLPIDTWETFTDWKCNYPYSIKLPTKLTVNNELSSKCFTGLGSSNTLYNFTIKVGYSWGVDATTIPPVCGSDVKCYDLLYKSVSASSPGHYIFPLYGTIMNKQIKGIGSYYSDSQSFIYEYPLSMNGKYFSVEFDFGPATPHQMLVKQPLVDTILSTIKTRN